MVDCVRFTTASGLAVLVMFIWCLFDCVWWLSCTFLLFCCFWVLWFGCLICVSLVVGAVVLRLLGWAMRFCLGFGCGLDLLVNL